MINIVRCVRAVFFVFLAVILATTGFGQSSVGSPSSGNSPHSRTVPAVPANAGAGVSATRKSVEQGSVGKSLARVPVDAMRVLSSSANGTVLEFLTDSFSTAGTSEGLTVSAPGFDRLAEPGEPDLPSRVIFVGVPQTGGVRLSVSTEGTETMSGARVRPAVGFDTRQSRVESRQASSGW